MARPIRILYPGAVYHITARGNERQRIFRDARDHEGFIDLLKTIVERFNLKLHAYCLMPNHYHLILETPSSNLSNALQWIQTTYTIRFNRRHKRFGHLFQGRYKAFLVDADSYAQQLILYTHLNPVRLRDKSALIPSEKNEHLQKYAWSSHKHYLGMQKHPNWLCMEWQSYFGGTRKQACHEYRKQIAQAFESAPENPFKCLKAGLVLGTEKILEKARVITSRSKGLEEIRWTDRREKEHIQKLLTRLLATQKDWRVQVWARVRLGGEGVRQVASELGYRDTSGVTQVVKRLEIEAQKNKRISAAMGQLRSEMSIVKV